MLVLAGCGVEGAPDGTPAGDSSSLAPSTPPNLDETPEPTVSDQAEPPSTRRQPVQPSPVPPPNEAPPRSTGEVPDQYLEQVMADAAGKARSAPDRVEVIRAQAMQWRSGALGCPEPGMMYTQALVDGYWVELRVGNQSYDYRLDGQGNFRLCERPMSAPPGTYDR